MTIVRVTLVLGGTAAYLGLAILGWGGWAAIFAHPARARILDERGFTVAEIVHALQISPRTAYRYLATEPTFKGTM